MGEEGAFVVKGVLVGYLWVLVGSKVGLGIVNGQVVMLVL